MSQSAIMAAVAAKNSESMRAALVGEFVPVIPAATDPQAWDPRELGVSGGNIFPAVIWQEIIWYRDADDAITAHDGITCIVTLDASRYKTNDVRFLNSVLSRTVTTPPTDDDSPAVALGDQYVVPAAATDDWADHDDEVAIWTARGWKYKTPAVGDILLVEDEGDTGEFIHFANDDLWTDGLPGNLVDLSVRPSALLIRSWAVEDQTTTAPPATGPAGEQYIIGASATGAWAGHDDKIAWRPSTDAAFVITAPFVGEIVYDKANATDYRWNGSEWVSASGVIVEADATTLNNDTTFSEAGTNIYVYSDSNASPPTTTDRYTEDSDADLTITSRRVGQRIQLIWNASVLEYNSTAQSAADAGAPILAVFRDAESSALKWIKLGTNAGAPFARYGMSFMFEIIADDTAEHTYHFRFMSYRVSNVRYRLQGGTIGRRIAEYRMFA